MEGLGITKIEDFADIINIRTAMHLMNNHNPLLRAAFNEGLDNDDNEDSIFSQMQNAMEKYSLEYVKGKGSFTCDEFTGNDFDIYTDSSRMNEKTGFGLYVKTNGKEYNLTFHINDNYSNNVAELTAIVIAVKYLPEKSKATIFTDPLQILKNKKYSGMFECLWKDSNTSVL